jgi:hypothetical protein
MWKIGSRTIAIQIRGVFVNIRIADRGVVVNIRIADSNRDPNQGVFVNILGLIRKLFIADDRRSRWSLLPLRSPAAAPDGPVEPVGILHSSPESEFF